MISLVAAVALLGGAWYLYTRSKGLTLTGQPANPMIAGAAIGNSFSPVAASNAVSTAATNVFSAISRGLATISAAVAKSTTAPGNAPQLTPANAAGVNPYQTSGVTATPGVPYVGDIPPSPDLYLDTSMPFWQWNQGATVPDVSGQNQAGSLGTGFAAGSEFMLDGELISV